MVEEAISTALAALRVQQERERQKVWHRYPEDKPTAEKDFCVIRQFRSNVAEIEGAKEGEIWVEMDYWHNGTDDWLGWESIGSDNPYWDTLYWIDLGRTEISLPDDLPSKVTRMFGEVVSQENEND